MPTIFKNKADQKKQSGFTLIELLVVISVIAALSGISLNAINKGKQTEIANDATKLSSLEKTCSALETFFEAEGGFYPEEGATNNPLASDASDANLAQIYLSNWPDEFIYNLDNSTGEFSVHVQNAKGTYYKCSSVFKDIKECASDTNLNSVSSCNLVTGSLEDPADPTNTAFCGNETCDPGENYTTCPTDCSAPSCGDGSCNGYENVTTCELDCPAFCPDGYCTHSETVDTCYDDCFVPAVCGDGSCNGSENASTCSLDCPAVCPDSFCTHTETNATCSSDCPLIDVCGDGQCTGLETLSSCAADCNVCGDGQCTAPYESLSSCPADCNVCGDGQCTTPYESLSSCAVDCSVCGDGQCTGLENLATCPSDCRICGDSICTAPYETLNNCVQDCHICGDGICSAPYETSANCLIDCPVASVCGNGICEPDENSLTCAKDCPSINPNQCSVDSDCNNFTCDIGCPYCNLALEPGSCACSFFACITPDPVEHLDQQNTTAGDIRNQTATFMQTFTAGQTGTLTRIELKVGPNVSSGTLNIRSGSGGTGTILSSTSVTLNGSSSWQSISFSSPASVVSGNVYTIQFVYASGTASFYYSPVDPYAGGRSSISATADNGFKTYVTY